MRKAQFFAAATTFYIRTTRAMQPAMLAALHRGAFATSSPSHRVRPSARASARGATITRAAGGFRVIEYGDGTTPESRGESRRRDDGFDDRGGYDRARPRGGRGGRGGRAFGGRGRGPPRRDRYDDDDDDDDDDGLGRASGPRRPGLASPEGTRRARHRRPARVRRRPRRRELGRAHSSRRSGIRRPLRGAEAVRPSSAPTRLRPRRVFLPRR